MKHPILLLLLSTMVCSSHGFSLKQLNPFRGDIEDEILSKEYDFDEGGTFELDNKLGDVDVKTWDQHKIMLEGRKKGTFDELRSTFINIKINHKTAIIQTIAQDHDDVAEVAYTLYIPKQTSVKVRNKKGKVKLVNIDAPVDVINEEGDISITAINSVQAKALKGRVKLKQRRLNPNGYAFIEASNGAELALANTLNVNLRLKTLRGNISIDTYITLEPITTKINKETWERLKRDIKATIGTGDAPITVDVIKGDIKITEL